MGIPQTQVCSSSNLFLRYVGETCSFPAAVNCFSVKKWECSFLKSAGLNSKTFQLLIESSWNLCVVPRDFCHIILTFAVLAELPDSYHHKVINDDLEKAYTDLRDIISKVCLNIFLQFFRKKGSQWSQRLKMRKYESQNFPLNIVMILNEFLNKCKFILQARFFSSSRNWSHETQNLL